MLQKLSCNTVGVFTSCKAADFSCKTVVKVPISLIRTVYNMETTLKNLILTIENTDLKYKEGFNDLSKQVTETVDRVEKLSQQISDEIEMSQDEFETVKKLIESTNIVDIKDAIKTINERIDTIQLKHGKDGKDGKPGKDGKNGINGKNGKDGKDGIDGKDGVEITAEQVRDKLESLEDDERIDKTAIKGIKEIEDRIDNMSIGGNVIINRTGTTGSTGLSSVSTDSTLTGNGTPSLPLGFVGVTTDSLSILGDGVNTPLSAVTNPTGKGLKKGGAIWSGTGFVFDVSDLYFYIDGADYVSAATQVTLAASDPTQDRFDIIVVDDTLTVSVITGTPGNPPAQPALDWNQVGVTVVLISAASTTPTITYDLMYNEDAGSPTEWVAGTYSLSGAAGTINNASTVNPFNGSKCITATSVNLRRGSVLTRGTDVNIQNFSTIQFAFRLDSAITNSQNFNIRFRNSGGTFIGNTVSVFNWGASRTVIGTNQVVVIPITAFGNITNVRSIVGIMAGGYNTPTYNWAWDFIKLSDSIPFQNNLGPIYLSPSNTLYSSGAANGATAVADSIFFGSNAGFQASSALSSIALGKNTGYGATNAANSQFIGENSGYGASSAYSSTFIGVDSGKSAPNAYQSVFIGRDAGNGATLAGDSFFLGYQAGLNASAASTASFLGSQAGSGATNAAGGVFIGYQAGLSAVDSVSSVFIGQQAGSGATNTAPSIAIGAIATPGAFNNSIAIGTAATNTANNQFIVGSSSIPITNVLLGDHTNTVNGDTINIDGANDRIDMMAHGENRSSMVGKIISLTDNTVTSIFEIALPAGGMTGGFFTANITATDGTDFQAHSDHVTYAAVNKGGAYTTTIQASNGDDAIAASTGTLAVTWSITTGTNKIIIRVNANSSLTAPTINLRLNIMNNGGQVITIL